MPKLWVNQEGTWKQVKVLWIKQNGTWVNPKIGIVNQDGIGKQFYPDAQLDISYKVPGRYTYEVPNGVTNLKIVAQGGGGGGGMGAFQRVRNYVVWLSYETGKSIKGGTRRNYHNPIILPEGYFPDETVRFGDLYPTLAASAGQSDWAFHKSSWVDGVYGLLWYPDTVFVGSDIDDDFDEYQVRWTSFEYGIDVDARIEGGGAPEYGSLADIYLPLGIYPEATLGDPDYKVNFSLDLPSDYVSHLHIPSHRPGYYARRWVPGVPFKRTLIARGRDGYPGKRLEGNLSVTPGDIITVDVGGGGYPGGARRRITGFTSNTYSETTTVSKTYTKSIDIVVPTGVTSLTLSATGAGGGAGGPDGGGSGYAGYPGAVISGTLAVTPGANVSISIGSGGTGGSYTTNGGNGLGGISELGYNGGNGGKSGATGVSGGGGGGGAATVIKYNGTIIAVAGGGGGGGGAGLKSAGKAQNGTSLTAIIVGGAGQNKSGDGGGGGGGGGGFLGGTGGALVTGDSGAYSGINGSNLLPSGWVAGLGNNGGAASVGSKYNPGEDGIPGSVTVTYTVVNTYQIVKPIITTSLFNSAGGSSTLGYNGGNGSIGGIDIIRDDDRDEFKFHGEVKTYVVPLGISTVYVSMTGGGGGKGGDDSSTGHLGFSGQQIRGNLAVTPGDTIAVYVGKAGEPGDNSDKAGGQGGLCRLDGFDGGIGGAAGELGRSGAGGGGGAATVITLNGTIVAVAGGGGGGGGGGNKSTGAGQAALTYNTSTNGENGQSKTGNRVVVENSSTKIFYDKAGTREFKVPTGLTSITVSIIGAGGSGGDGAGAGGSNDGPRGGYAGTVVTSTIAVTPGETLTFNVGVGGSPVTYSSGLSGNAGKPTTVYRGNTLLLSAAGGNGGGRNTSGTTLSKGDASAAPFNQPGGTFTWGGQGGDGYLGSGGGGVDGSAKYKTSGKGGDGAVLFEIPNYVTILEDADGGGGGGGGGGYPTGGSGGKTRTGDVGAYSGISGKSLLPSGWIALDGGNPGKDGTAFISPSAKFDAGRVGGGGGGAATVIQKNGVTIAVAAGGGGGGAGLFADSLAQTEKYISSGTHAGGAAYTESDRNDRGVGGGGGGGGYNGGAGSQGFNFADEIGLIADYNWTKHDHGKCYDRQNNYEKIDADIFDTVLGRYLTTKFKSHYFKGSDNSHGKIKYNSKFALTLVKGSSFSLEAWICATGSGQDSTYGGMIINKETDYKMARLPDGRIAVAIDWNVGTDINLPDKGWIIPPANTAVVPLNEASYVVVSVANQVLNIYINGVLAWSKTDLDRQPTNSTKDIEIGKKFQGYITNIRFWNVARTAEQVKQDYDAYTWGGRPDWGPSSGYSGQSLVPNGWKEYLAAGETFTTTVSAVIDLDRPSTWTLGTNSIVDEYTDFKYLKKPDDEIFKSNVLVFGYSVNSTTPETRSLTTSNKINLNPYSTLLYEVNKGTIKDWGQEPEPDEFLYLEYSLDGSTWLVIDKVLPSIIKANKWYTRQLALTQRGIRSTDGVYLRFRQTRTGGLPKPRDTWAVSPLIAVSQRVIGIANPGLRQEFGFYATKGGDGLATISPQDANLNTYYAAGTYSYTVPVGITELLVTVVGAGGGSASTTGTAAGGAGGSGGVQENQIITVIPGETLTIEVGDGGAGGTGSGTASTGKTGGVSRILRGTTLIIEARGGAGGTKDINGSGGAGGVGGTPDGDRGDNGPIITAGTVSSGGGQNALGLGGGGDYTVSSGPGNPGAVGFVSIGFVG